MEDRSYIILMLIISVATLIIRFFTNGRKDLYFYASLFYFFFTFGTVINYLLGIPIYFGTPHSYIPVASTIFMLAIVTMSVCSLILPNIRTSNLGKIEHSYQLLAPLLIIFIGYSVLQSGYVLLFSLGGSKVDKINFLIPKIHYNYLMIQIFLCSFFFLLKDSKLKALYWLNFVGYIFYCLVVGERDFIFILTSMALHTLLYTKMNKKKIFLLVSGLFSFFFLGTLIFFLRDKHQSSTGILAGILNQGSLLFINSFTAKLMDESYQFFNGFTYFNSILNLLPSWIYKTDFNNLSWFKNNYAPASTSGYGFGLDAEGYMNFGYFGVVLTFIFVTIWQRLIIRNINRNDFFKYYSVFFICTLMYNFRNDSLAFLKGNLYAVIFYFLIYMATGFLSKNQTQDLNQEQSQS